MAWHDAYITKTEGVQGGAPVLKGTRTPVLTVLILSRDVYPGHPEEVEAALPHLTPKQIEAARAYAQDHKDEICADLERHERALRDIPAA